jgi:hypothetical protein
MQPLLGRTHNAWALPLSPPAASHAERLLFFLKAVAAQYGSEHREPGLAQGM